MPHSSGGGSHSGGHHSSFSSSRSSSSFSSSRSSSSFSSSRSGGGSRSDGYHVGSFTRPSYSSSRPSPSRPRVSYHPTVSASAFAGARRYVYYRNSAPIYVYSNYGNTSGQGLHIGRLLIYLVIVLAMASAFMDLVSPQPKVSTNYNHAIVVEDSIGVIDSESQLKAALESFFDATGISPAVITVENKDWNHFYSDLSNYAYDLYVNRFSDERHWLLVYSQPKGASGAYVDWFWEGIQGDETDGILTRDAVERFGNLLQKYLTANSRYTVGDAFAQAFRDFTPTVRDTGSVSADTVVIDLLLILGIIVLGLYRSGILHKKEKRPTDLPEDAEVVSEDSSEITCEYCSGVYLSNAVRCPHCGAAKTQKAKKAEVP